MKKYPLNGIDPLFPNSLSTFASLGIKINPSLEGLTATEEMLSSKKLLSLEFNWLPARVVETYNSAQTAITKKEVLVEKVYGNCKLNCKGCYVKQDDLFRNHNLIHPNQIMDLIEESVTNLGTKTVKYLGPSEFFRDQDVFKYLDRFQKMNVILGVFVKDPMFGDDQEVAKLFGNQGIHTSEELIIKLASYQNLRLLFNFRSFDEAKTNDLVRGGYQGKEDYAGNYKEVQTRALQLLYKHFALAEINKQRESRLVIVNTPITADTIDEAYEIFTYFIDRGVTVISTTSMQSGCGGGLYDKLNAEFMMKFQEYYVKIIKYSLKRGLISPDYFKKFGPSPYAGCSHCLQLCNGLLIRETGQLMRCPGADHEAWRDEITPEELLKNGLAWAWTKTRNYQENSKVNVGCLAKPKIFTPEFKEQVIKGVNL
jgi:esterase/lipase superfamily enzyme